MTRAGINRIVLIVLDGVGVGALPDADFYGDAGSDTLGNLSRAVGPLDLPNLERLGLGHLTEICGLRNHRPVLGTFGKCAERSVGKDSISGHWEMMGVVTETPFPVYPDGFPDDLLAEFSRRIGRPVLWGKPASGTEIIARLGDRHVATGAPIVYTSVDSVFQIAAHEEVIPPAEQYRICRVARELLQGRHGVGRVIARPFTGSAGDYFRTPNRHDFSLPPPPHLLDRLDAAQIPVVGIGKIDDLYAHRGIGKVVPTRDNRDGMEKIAAEMRSTRRGLIMANLVEFDQNWGHRNDAGGFKSGLEAFDRFLGPLVGSLAPGDALIITADHGVDPTTPSTDHSREYIPFLACGRHVQADHPVGIRKSFADIGATLAEIFSVPPPPAGTPIPGFG